MNVYCIPFAGGSEYSYRPFQQKAPAFLRIKCLKLPGRGSRINEALLADLDGLVNDLYQQIKGELSESYSIYGHSMGSILAYLLTQRIINEGHQPPLHLFLTGSKSPTMREDNDHLRHLLPKEKFVHELRVLGGCPEEVLNDEDLMNFIEPILRADFRAIETYVKEDLVKLDVPFTVMIGSKERTSLEEAAAWSHLTTSTCEAFELEGDHFFIFNHVEYILNVMAGKIPDARAHSMQQKAKLI